MKFSRGEFWINHYMKFSREQFSIKIKQTPSLEPRLKILIKIHPNKALCKCLSWHCKSWQNVQRLCFGSFLAIKSNPSAMNLLPYIGCRDGLTYFFGWPSGHHAWGFQKVQKFENLSMLKTPPQLRFVRMKRFCLKGFSDLNVFA